jgi:hypothetical protein
MFCPGHGLGFQSAGLKTYCALCGLAIVWISHALAMGRTNHDLAFPCAGVTMCLSGYWLGFPWADRGLTISWAGLTMTLPGHCLGWE